MTAALFCAALAVTILAMICGTRIYARDAYKKGVESGRQACALEHNAMLVGERTKLMEDCDTLRQQLEELKRYYTQISPKAALADVYRTVRDEIVRIEQQLKDASNQYKLIGEDTHFVLQCHWEKEATSEHVESNNDVRSNFETKVFPALNAQLEAARTRLMEIATEAASLESETTSLTKA